MLLVVSLTLTLLAACSQQISVPAKPAVQEEVPVAEAPAATATPATPTNTPSPVPQPTLPPPAQGIPSGSPLKAVWGNLASDIFVVGDHGVILHYDGEAWTLIVSDTPVKLDTVWGSSGRDVFAAGDLGTILHYDGTTWSAMDSGTMDRIWGIWGNSDHDVFAIGNHGTILHYNSSVWSAVDSGTKTDLIGIWGSSGRDIFTVGRDGTILHYDGDVWSPMDSDTAINLWSIWGNSRDDVYAIGDYGTILHYDGTTWSPMDSGANVNLWGIWGSSRNDVFTIGDLGTILHYDRSAWSSMDSDTTFNIGSVWGSSSSDVFIVGDNSTILHYDGLAWSDVSSGAAVATARTATPRPTVEIKREQFTSQALAGNLLGDPAERRFFVLLPPGYASSDKRYPVVYVMPWADGMPGDSAAGLKTTMESLLLNNAINEMIVVVPNGNTRLGASHMLSSAVIGDYETYVTQEIVDYVDAHYRTLPSRDSRGLAGCSNGGGPAVRLGMKYPNIFSVVTAADGEYNASLDAWPQDVADIRRVTQLPQRLTDIAQADFDEYYQMAAATAPDPNNPHFYFEMPIRIVNGHGEFVPEVIAKIVEQDAMHEVRRYAEQPVRLRGIFIRRGTYDTELKMQAESFEQLLNDLAIEHEYREVEGTHCSHGWDEDSLMYLSDKLVFEE